MIWFKRLRTLVQLSFKKCKREYASSKNPETVYCGVKIISKNDVNTIAGVKEYEDDIIQV